MVGGSHVLHTLSLLPFQLGLCLLACVAVSAVCLLPRYGWEGQPASDDANKGGAEGDGEEGDEEGDEEKGDEEEGDGAVEKLGAMCAKGRL